MNARELKPILRALLPCFPGFVGHKRLFLLAPMNGMLRAIHFDPSAYDKLSFYPSTLVMPLCVPNEHLSLLLGDRLRHRTESYYWKADLPNLIPELVEAIRIQGLAVLSQAASIEGFLTLARKKEGNPHTNKYVAFMLARAGEHERAIALIDEYLPKLRLDSHWEKEIFDISRRLRGMLISDPDMAERQLLEWEDYTIKKLGLEAFR